MSKWFNFYKDRTCNESYEEYFKKKYAPFLNYIKESIKPNYRVAELGCGTSLVTKLVYSPKTSFLVGDSDRMMLELTSSQLGNREVTKKQIDIREPLKDNFHLIYSHGVLEHFDLLEVCKIISHQLQASNHLVHYVPSAKYKVPSFGDERLLTPKQWKDILGVPEIREFNNGYDLMLIWRYK